MGPDTLRVSAGLCLHGPCGHCCAAVKKAALSSGLPSFSTWNRVSSRDSETLTKVLPLRMLAVLPLDQTQGLQTPPARTDPASEARDSAESRSDPASAVDAGWE